MSGTCKSCRRPLTIPARNQERSSRKEQPEPAFTHSQGLESAGANLQSRHISACVSFGRGIGQLAVTAYGYRDRIVPWLDRLVRSVQSIVSRPRENGSLFQFGACGLGAVCCVYAMSLLVFTDDADSGTATPQEATVRNQPLAAPDSTRPDAVQHRSNVLAGHTRTLRQTDRTSTKTAGSGTASSRDVNSISDLTYRELSTASVSSASSGDTYLEIPKALTSEFATREEVARAAARVLDGRKSAPELFNAALPIIAGHLQSDDRWVMVSVAYEFFQLSLDSPEALKPVESQIVAALARDLPTRNDKEESDAGAARHWLAYTVRSMHADSAVPVLIRLISNDLARIGDDTLSAILQCLSEFYVDNQYHEPLAKALSPLIDDHRHYRVEAIQAIGNCGDSGRQLIPELRKLLVREDAGFNDSPRQSLTVAGTICVLDPTQKDMLRLLIQYVANADRRAARQLARCGPAATDALPVLCGRLEVSQNSDEIDALVLAVMRISPDDPRVRQVLNALLHHERSYIADSVRKVLNRVEAENIRKEQ